jgi:thymidine phosphorylase
MKTQKESLELADSLVTVANGAGVKTGALITDMNEPLASAAGNALEVRNAVDFLTGVHRDPRLSEVTLELSAAALVLAGRQRDHDMALKQATEALETGAAAVKFSRMVSALGGPADFVENMDAHMEAAPIIRDVHPRRPGRITSINTRGIGMAVVALGGGRRTPSDRIDYAVGFDQLVGIGTEVGPTAPIARIHARDETSAAEAATRLVEAYEMRGETVDHPLIADTIMPGAS